MKKFFLGLGNPGEKYELTRHNAGQIFLDWWAKKEGWVWQRRKDLLAFLAEGKGVVLAKPLVFMNEAGKTAWRLKEKLDFSPQELVVVHDELDLPLGKWKLTFGKSSPLHKGVASVEDYLKTTDFWRLRLGINKRDPRNRIPGEVYVLERFKKEEKKILEGTFNQIF